MFYSLDLDVVFIQSKRDLPLAISGSGASGRKVISLGYKTKTECVIVFN